MEYIIGNWFEQSEHKQKHAYMCVCVCACVRACVRICTSSICTRACKKRDCQRVVREIHLQWFRVDDGQLYDMNVTMSRMPSVIGILLAMAHEFMKHGIVSQPPHKGKLKKSIINKAEQQHIETTVAYIARWGLPAVFRKSV